MDEVERAIGGEVFTLPEKHFGFDSYEVDTFLRKGELGQELPMAVTSKEDMPPFRWEIRGKGIPQTTITTKEVGGIVTQIDIEGQVNLKSQKEIARSPFNKPFFYCLIGMFFSTPEAAEAAQDELKDMMQAITPILQGKKESLTTPFLGVQVELYVNQKEPITNALTMCGLHRCNGCWQILA